MTKKITFALLLAICLLLSAAPDASAQTYYATLAVNDLYYAYYYNYYSWYATSFYGDPNDAYYACYYSLYAYYYAYYAFYYESRGDFAIAFSYFNYASMLSYQSYLAAMSHYNRTGDPNASAGYSYAYSGYYYAYLASNGF